MQLYRPISNRPIQLHNCTFLADHTAACSIGYSIGMHDTVVSLSVRLRRTVLWHSGLV